MVVGFRLFKQLIIATTVLVAFGVIVLWGMRTFSTPVATPTPDPIAKLAPVEVLKTYLFSAGERDYDFLAQVRNPNATYGAGVVSYTLDLVFDGTGGKESVTTIDGSFYILPGQTKYIVLSPIKTALPIQSMKMHIINIAWQELDPLAVSSSVNLTVTAASFIPSTQAPLAGKVGGSARNNSDFDLEAVDVAVILMDSEGNPVGASRTEIRTFLAHTARGFEVAWYAKPTSNVDHVLAEGNANLFRNRTFIRTYGGIEQFQTY